MGLVEVEDFFQRGHAVVGFYAVEEGGHVMLPAGIDREGFHFGYGFVEVLRDEVTDEQAVGAEEECVVLPAGVGERGSHLGPDLAVTSLVLL